MLMAGRPHGPHRSKPGSAMISNIEAADLCSVSYHTMFRRARDPNFEVKAVKVGGQIRWPRAALMRYLGIEDESVEVTADVSP